MTGGRHHTGAATPAPDAVHVSRPVTVAQRSDPLEREADRLANRVMRLQAGPSQGPIDQAPAIGRYARSSPLVGDLLDGSGRPLPTALRKSLEGRFEHDLTDVRIHDGLRAREAAGSLRAQAFTLGPHIAFARGQFAPFTSTGRGLLAHEIAHVVQQRERTRPGDVVFRREADTDFALPQTRSFAELWIEFERARQGIFAIGGSAGPSALVLARQLALAMHDIDDTLAHGVDLAAWLQRNGESDLAGRVLASVRSAFLVRFVTQNSQLPGLFGLTLAGSAPGTLITAGKESARAGDHRRAFELFGVAHELLSYYALESTARRDVALADEYAADAAARAPDADWPQRAAVEARELPRAIGRSRQYGDLRALYNGMREIYGFYYVLEREARDAGDSTAAQAARTNASALHAELRDRYTWGGAQGARGIGQEVLEPVEIAEVSYTDTPRGPGLRLHGANGTDTELTRLPGLPSPREVGNNVQVQNIGDLQAALMAQTDFQAEIGRQPAIRSAFGDQPIDLTNAAQRQRVWRIMFEVYRGEGPGALGRLMALVGRFLRAFTVHTTFNIRDWGVSYLDVEMPTDLAGRLEQDCGVYAVTVAWDVFQAVRAGDRRARVRFELVSMLEHVSLLITDEDAGEYYIVNNDEVSGPSSGSALGQLARHYGGVRGLGHTVGPAVKVDLGSTRDAVGGFRRRVWQRYLAATDWGLAVDEPADVTALRRTDPAEYARRSGELLEQRYRRFYADQESFDRGVRALAAELDTLSASGGTRATYERALARVTATAAPLAGLFIQLGPRAGVVAGSRRTLALLPSNPLYLFTQDVGRSVHPLVRVALAVLHLQALGGTPTPQQQALVDMARAVPEFRTTVDAYSAAGATGPF